MKALLNRLRRQLARFIMPAVDLAAEKQRIQKLAQEIGHSRSVAKAIAGRWLER